MFKTTHRIALAAWCAGAMLAVGDAAEPMAPVTARQTIALDQPRPELDAFPPVVSAVALSPDGRTLLTAGDDQRVRLWSIDAQR
ncbi:MAG: WD40 repeat domain-containing protein, partial [Patescibacteria group bacterium]|nr:WD40 repeat domain-containing protein [Patescibacteria group bacterium]